MDLESLAGAENFAIKIEDLNSIDGISQVCIVHSHKLVDYKR